MCLVTLFFYLPRLIRQLIKDETVVIFNILFYLIFFVTSLESVNLTRENITTRRINTDVPVDVNL